MDQYTITKWTPWDERLGIQGIGHPGVYLLAHFPNTPPPEVDPTDPAIVYIGETCRSLRGRWGSFHRAITGAAQGHSGGLTYHASFCSEDPESYKRQLYVAAAPVELDEPHRSALIRHVERRMLWDFVQRHGRYPTCNSK